MPATHTLSDPTGRRGEDHSDEAQRTRIYHGGLTNQPPFRGARTRGDVTVDDQPMGRRVAYWRNRRRMSQQLFADRLGKSKSWVDKVERGVRRLDRFSVIYEIADVL